MLCEPALLGQHANRYGGGSTCHAQGSDSTTRTNGYAEKRPTLPGRAPRTTTNTATPHTMLKGQGLRPAVTPMGAPRRILPAREHLRQAPTGAAHIMQKDQERRPQRVHTAVPRPTTRESARLERLLRVRLHTPAIITTVGQLRFIIRRLLSTPTQRAATTAEAGPQPVQQLQA